ncbi:MAG: bifunctional diaminohydroxyphosphoribosylaminopyrimidine deaminase/5-amino-6-(5-phosphoribosylamino)uracil reductase RibD [Psychromonas sp.]|nr:bifunctional diaminohydroxyphosphoribosylaminopyrimidine deaminase/5-amino-6-(5-phosphoribosylamino)uracil reductase RibD [Psychromonas sp.]
MAFSKFSKKDHYYMSRAIELARKGRFTTSPNPNVGSVIVNNDQIVGEGYHFKAGNPHAEVHALCMAKLNAKGATCYVTLEPCTHFGRTPPCSTALIKSGVKRVVIAMIDPNPKVAGKGVSILQSANIDVEVGLLEKEANQLNRGFIKRMKTSRPRVTVKLASSLDGKTALANGQSKWITGPEARIDVQGFRAIQSAILTSINTVLADDPSLNVRFDELQQSEQFHQEINASQLRQPIRIILDAKNRLTLNEKLFSISGRVIIISLSSRDDLTQSFVAEVEQLIVKADENQRIDLKSLLLKLGKLEINDLLIESGSVLSGQFFEKSLFDEFILYQAPKLMGNDARNLVNLPLYSKMSDIMALSIIDVRIVGDDIRIIGYGV